MTLHLENVRKRSFVQRGGTQSANSSPPQDQRTQAVLALLHGEPDASVSARYGIGA